MVSLAVIAVPVSDQIKAKEFYLRIGFELLAEEMMNDKYRWIQLGLPGNITTISLVTWFKEMPPGSLQGLVLATDSIEEDYVNFKRQGLSVSILSQTPNGKYFTVRDPDGNGISFQQNSDQ